MDMTDRKNRSATVTHNGRPWTIALRFRDSGSGWTVLVSPQRLPTDGARPLPSGRTIMSTVARGADPVAVFEREVRNYGGEAA